MDHGYFQPASPTSPQPPNAKMVAFRDENYVLPPPPRQPTLFGVRCTEISQRAYTGKSSEMKKSFDRLQRLDNGKVEYRTIGKRLILHPLDRVALGTKHPVPIHFILCRQHNV
ncbi:hypothetical protein BGZ50_002538 [Haplosporangium sp. Z 11]|nr:hypothetical protein BGZ50_002538 [Haplosporangium sp. Z 11]